MESDKVHWGRTKLYGSIEIDLERVGAPLCDDDVPIDSKDPDAPGVLVTQVDWEPEYPPGTPVLLIGTGMNLNPAIGIVVPEGVEVISGALDGCGIGLWVQQIDSKGFSGIWDAWGIVHNGTGVFCATIIKE